MIIAVVPAIWVWMFNDAFWFYYALPHHLEAVSALKRLGMYSVNAPDWAYVTLTMVLWGLFLAYIVLTFTIWHKRKEDTLPGDGVVSTGAVIACHQDK